MPRTMKVYGITLMATPADVAKTNTPCGRQVRAIVAAPSRTAAARAFGVTPNYMKDYGGDTGNERELAAAMPRPGVVLIRGLDDNRGEYVPREDE